MNLSEKLAEYALSLRYEDLGDAVVMKTKQHIVDTLACGLGAQDAEPVKAAIRLAQCFPAPSSSILGSFQKTTPDMAAFVNGTMVRYFDFNDGYIGKAPGKEPGHPSDNIPACMAVAEAENASVQDLIVSIVLAYEIQARFQDAANLYKRGWDHVNYVLIASTVAAGWLMKLTPHQLTQAINIAVNGHISLRQSRSGELSSWKGCSAPNASRNAIFSALAARQGITGPSPIFEGEMGFLKQITGPFEMDPSNFGGCREPFMMSKMLTKMFPTNGELQTAIWAALELRELVPDLSEIESIALETTDLGFKFLGKDPEKWRPQSRETADHSLPYNVARALFDGAIDVESYAEEKFKDPAILVFMKKISVAEDKELTALLPEFIPNRVTIRMTSGVIHSKQINKARGMLDNPMSNEDFNSKFKSMTLKHYSAEQQSAAINFLWNLEHQPSVARLFQLLAR